MPLCRLLTGWGAAGRGGGTVCCRILGSAHPQRRCAQRCAEQEAPFGPGAVCLSAVLSGFGFCSPHVCGWHCPGLGFAKSQS